MPKEGKKHQKTYVVFTGITPGIYDTWDECKANVNGFPGASFASFSTRLEAQQAFGVGDLKKWKEGGETVRCDAWKYILPIKDGPCLTVDAACSGSPGVMEFQGVLLPSKAIAFHHGPYKNATNNIGEFLAIVTGFKWLFARSLDMLIYSDSACAISWITHGGKCNTTMEPENQSPETRQAIEEAERFMRGPTAPKYIKMLRKWETKDWGEIPADFGRK